MEDDIDIYGDLDHTNDEKTQISVADAKDLQQKNAELEAKVDELNGELDKLQKYCKSLETNISSLHKTARVEIARKDRMISDLRQQIDNAAFRRNNFRIPKRITKPVVFPPPPKEEPIHPVINKKEVNDTINKDETVYTSPLLKTEEDSDDGEQTYQPEKIPVTLFGERLKRRLQQEAREEAKAAKQCLRDQEKSSNEKNATADTVSDEISGNKEDKENKYRLIPLTLMKQSENSRKREAQDVEEAEESTLAKKSMLRANDDTSNSNAKRRRINDNQSTREKSLKVDRHNNSVPASEDRKRLEIEAEYFCPAQSTHDEINSKRHCESKADSSRSAKYKKIRNSRSRSRSRSRERWERREESRDFHLSPDRRKNGRIRSKSPSRKYDGEKLDTYRSTRRNNYNSNDHDDSERVKGDLWSRKRGSRRAASPPARRMDLRQRLSRKSDKIDKKGNNELRSSNETKSRSKSSSDNRRGDRGRERPPENSSGSQLESNRYDRRHQSKLMTIEECNNKNDRRATNRSKSSSSDRPRTSRLHSVDEKNKNSIDEIVEEEKTVKNSNTRESTEAILDCLEEGEIPDSPGSAIIVTPGCKISDNEVAPSTGKEDLPMVNQMDPCSSPKYERIENLDESIKEEKIENIERFIQKMQKKDEELHETGKGDNADEGKSIGDENDKSVVSAEKMLKIHNEKIEVTPRKSNKTNSCRNEITTQNSVLLKYLNGAQTVSNATVFEKTSEIEENHFVAEFRAEQSGTLAVHTLSSSESKIIKDEIRNTDDDKSAMVSSNTVKNNTNTEIALNGDNSNSETKMNQAVCEKNIDESALLLQEFSHSRLNSVGHNKSNEGEEKSDMHSDNLLKHSVHKNKTTLEEEADVKNYVRDVKTTSVSEQEPNIEKIPQVSDALVIVKEDKLSPNTSAQSVCDSNAVHCNESPKKNLLEEISKTPSKSPDCLQQPRIILQQIDSPVKTPMKTVEIAQQKAEPKEKENNIKSTVGQNSRVVVVARRRKVKLTDSSTSMTVVQSAKNTPTTIKNK